MAFEDQHQNQFKHLGFSKCNFCLEYEDKPLDNNKIVANDSKINFKDTISLKKEFLTFHLLCFATLCCLLNKNTFNNELIILLQMEKLCSQNLPDILLFIPSP